jgi:hypothetical protein
MGYANMFVSVVFNTVNDAQVRDLLLSKRYNFQRHCRDLLLDFPFAILAVFYGALAVDLMIFSLLYRQQISQ